MERLEIDGFELNKEQINMLLEELKEQKVKTMTDLESYLKDHEYSKDTARKYHLLVSKYPKKRSFAIPFEK